ncbi:MAG: hypothetical protein JXA58_08270 [Dehalococcoidia bacterium]|nr:hypothetical protein [Dehalococcoidia bacterium]
MPAILVCGAINWDTTCLVAHLPIPGEEVTCDSVSEVPGGTGANTAVAAARILGPGEVALFAALGRDDIARVQLGILEAEGVAYDHVVQLSGQMSGHAYILVDHEGQNVIASSLGANSMLNPRHARQAKLTTLMQRCRCVALTDPPLPVAAYLVETAVALDIPALWDPGVTVTAGWGALAPLARLVDSLILNEAEAVQLFGDADPWAILRSIDPNRAPKTIVLKLGARGSLLLQCTTGIINRIPALPLDALGLEVLSTVGCGDVFLGAMAAFRAEGHARHEALMMSSAAAGLKATRAETRGGPTRKELDGILSRAASVGFVISAEGEFSS